MQKAVGIEVRLLMDDPQPADITSFKLAVEKWAQKLEEETARTVDVQGVVKLYDVVTGGALHE